MSKDSKERTPAICDVGFAKVDLERKRRRGFGEVIFGAGKTNEQLRELCTVFRRHKQRVLITRCSAEQAAFVLQNEADLVCDPLARLLYPADLDTTRKVGNIAVCTGGTADIPVAEEAARTAEFLGAEVHRHYDVGVAGLHRLLAVVEELRTAHAIVAVAGMDGALPSMIAGLVESPLIAVPTSVGYGASFQGLAPLLTMLNACTEGVTVVNIDNGFGAGYRIPLRPSSIGTELVTPTGIAIAVALRTREALPSSFRILRCGIGLGKKDVGRPNVLRAMLLSDEEANKPIFILECNIDDSTGEELGLAMERLFAAGAYDVHFMPCFMKKNRPGWLLRVIASRQNLATLERTIFAATTTIGIRRIPVERTYMERERMQVETSFGSVQIKKCRFGELVHYYPEYESVKRLAEESGADFRRIFREAICKAEADGK